jgi:hypothetical protein
MNAELIHPQQGVDFRSKHLVEEEGFDPNLLMMPTPPSAPNEGKCLGDPLRVEHLEPTKNEFSPELQ